MDTKTQGVERKSILCIVPLPPPITGAAIASETIVDYLKRYYEVVVIPYQRGNLTSGKFSLRQFFRIIAIGVKLMLIKKHFDTVYYVGSTTFWGNLRDIFLLSIIGNKRRHSAVMHLHGGGSDKYLSTSPWIMRYINKELLKDIRAVVVVGETWREFCDEYIPQEKIKIVKNGIQKEMFISHELLLRKYTNIDKVNILFLSNMIREKGYDDVLEGYLLLPEKLRKKTTLHFAGYFDNEYDKNAFLEKIEKEPNIFYHGAVKGKEKVKLFWDAHIFCFPTYYYEAQPITILEAYASGCIVITRNKGGIKDIFKHKVNGFWLESNATSAELKKYLEVLIEGIDQYKNWAFSNRKECEEEYTIEKFCEEMQQIIIGQNK